MTPPLERCRLDVWLWRARFFKTRTLAAGVVAAGGVRLERNGQSRAADKPSLPVEPGDGLSFRMGGALRTVRVLAVGTRRGPATEARALYAEIAPALDDPGAADHVHDAPKEPE
jgi:ribosome-associated heat shock protein Hsp15